MEKEIQEVHVTDIDISFSSMVWLMVKASFAAIPAMILIWIIWSVLGGMMIALL